MIVLSQTTDKIQVVLAGAITTNQLQCVASWRDITATPTYTAGRSVAVTNNTTDVDLIAAPGASTQRIVDRISIYNADTASATVTVKYDANGTDYIIWKGTLATGEKAEFDNAGGWSKVSASGAVVTSGIAGADGADGLLSLNETEIDFGASPSWPKAFTISHTGVTTTSKIVALQSGKAATGREADENEMDKLIFACNPGTDSFTLYATPLRGRVGGKYKVNYFVS